jgi:spore maturation protein SpmB
MQTSLTIIPYLVGMLVAIGVLRNSGVLGFVVAGFNWFFTQIGVNTDFTSALPTALMKPLSGSGSRAMMVDAMKTYGVDSFVGAWLVFFRDRRIPLFISSHCILALSVSVKPDMRFQWD